MPTEPDPAPPDLGLRPARGDEVAALAGVQLRARQDAGMPAPEGGLPALRERLTARLADGAEAWVGEAEGVVVGYLLLTDTWLDDLYVVPSAAGLGVGSALLDVAKSLRPGGFGLYVLADNARALAFYLGRGLTVVARHPDGGGPDAREEGGRPDVELAWGSGVGAR